MIPGILLAAGLSKRFGAQKLLASLGIDRTLFDRSLQTHLEASISPLIVVVSRGLLSALKGKAKYHISRRDVPEGYNVVTPWGKGRLIVNETPETGMADSLKLGIAALTDAERRGGVVISLADMPGITPDTIRRLVERFERGEEKIVVPTYGGRIGHPIIVHLPSFRDQIAAIKGDKGLRDILKAHWREAAEIPWENDSVIQDVDTPSDLEKIVLKGK